MTALESPIYRVFASFITLLGLLLFLPLVLGAALISGLIAMATVFFVSRQLVVHGPQAIPRPRAGQVTAPPESEIIDTTWTRVD